MILAGLLVAVSLTLPILYLRGPPYISYYLKFGTYYFSFFIVSLVALPYFVLRGRTADDPGFIIGLWRWIGRWIIGIHWEFSNSELELRLLLRNAIKGGAVIVVNHQSSFDVIGLFYIWKVCGRLSIVGKKELLYLGPFGLACYYGGMTFIDRKRSSEALSFLSEAVIQNKKKNIPVLVFPEGTRNHDRYKPSLMPFKKGAFVAAIQAQVPIIPIVFSHYENMDIKENMLLPNRGTITVLESIPTKEKLLADDLSGLMEDTRQKMLETLVKTSSCRQSLANSSSTICQNVNS